MADTFEFFNGLRGLHVYHNLVNWVPYVEQNIVFKGEYNNKHDRSAVAKKTLVKDRMAPITNGHVPREPSRQTWFEIKEWAYFEAMVRNTKSRPSPLVQGGLEILIRIKVVWPLVEKLLIYITKVEQIKYPVTGEYVDDSEEIFKDLVVSKAVESLDDDEDVELGDIKDENCKDNEIIEWFIIQYFFLSRSGVINP